MSSSAPAGSREGDWRCDACGNKNYAFRSFCNRCKQPRLLVDSKTPSDSKWLPRIGDWVCAGCSNNNYASRDKCNKCGTLKEVSALPAMALPGAAMAAPLFAPNAFGSAGGFGMGMQTGLLQHMRPTWGFNGASLNSNLENNSWRPGDWLCICGFHNYSSRSTCKKCSARVPVAGSMPALTPEVSMATEALPLLQAASMPLGVGIKRPAPDDLRNDLKRIHTSGEQILPFQEQIPHLGVLPGAYGSLVHPEVGNVPPSNWQLQPQPHSLVPAIVGRGAEQWRSGDWMCVGCNNHNYASRLICNRCGGKKEVSQVLSVA